MTARNKKQAYPDWPEYQPQSFEPRLQRRWESLALHAAQESSDRPKYYCMDFFPYPSGDGLHVGHCRNYVPTDVLSRFMRMRGSNVLHPMGWDAFGEPTEQAAVRDGIHPGEYTRRNTANFRRQLTLIGTGYDWSREITSSNPEYYRWTQWFFLMLYRRGLAYRDTNFQWWCPICQTTLSNQEAAGGVCWRGHTGLLRREIPAWYFKITAYADELLSGLEAIDWPEPIKAMQRNWIGRSEGAEIHFPVDGLEARIFVFTTRADTLFGATFLVLAPEHDLVNVLTTPAHQAEVRAYQAQARQQSDVDRMQESRPKTGVFTGGFARHPLTGEELPAWIADYVLPGYGTGAVMGVPAHDQRDFEFAQAFGLPIQPVILPPGADRDSPARAGEAYPGEGTLINSGRFDGLSSIEGMQQVTAALQAQGLGDFKVSYRMRDWLISRQRYWGTPIPIVYCSACGEVPVPEKDLPVTLPEMDDFRPDGSGRSPLERVESFVQTTCPRCGGPARRETDTLGGFACSSWYFLRFTSPHYHAGPFQPEAMRYWMPVDMYVGGAEHAVLHLLYARFWTRVMADEGLLSFREPFQRLRNQGQLLGPDGQRMSKSRGNVITPDSVVAQFGADALRLYEMFMAPFDQDIAWSTEGLNGTLRFLNRVWTLYGETYSASADAHETDPELERLAHQTIRRVTERIEGFRLNTMVSALMEFANALGERQRAGNWQTASFHHALETLLLLLAPGAPHIADELWALTGHAGSVHQQDWPAWDSEIAQDETVQIAVQINGKVRGIMDAPVDASQEQVESLAFASPRLQPYLREAAIARIIYVPGRILNIVTM